MGKIPVVSIVMATCDDKPDFLRASISSILNQTFPDFEFLIIDDSSDQASISTIDAYNDERIRVIRKNPKMGFVKSLNTGLDEAKGSFIARMDADDISKPTRIERQVQFMTENKDVDILGGQLEIIDEAGKLTGLRKYPEGGITLFLYATFRNPVGHPSTMFRRRIIDQGFRYDEKVKNAEDLDLWLRLINSGHKFINLPDVILEYRVTHDFNEKRLQNGRKQDIAVMNVTRKHATLKKPIFYGLSLFFCALRGIVPAFIRDLLYRRENQRLLLN